MTILYSKEIYQLAHLKTPVLQVRTWMSFRTNSLTWRGMVSSLKSAARNNQMYKMNMQDAFPTIPKRGVPTNLFWEDRAFEVEFLNTFQTS